MHRRALLVLPLSALLLAGCGGNNDDPTLSAPSPTASPTPSPTASPTASPTPTLPAGVDQQVVFSIANKKVTGPAGRVKVKVNTTVQLVVTSDIADEVHLHGYDKHVDVTAGGTATLTFKASIPGVFEVELENTTLTITHLQVQ